MDSFHSGKNNEIRNGLYVKVLRITNLGHKWKEWGQEMQSSVSGHYQYTAHREQLLLPSPQHFWDCAALVIMCQIKTFSPASHPLEETKFGILLKLSSRNFLAIVFTDIYKQIQFPVCSRRRQQRKPALREFL